MDAIPTAVLEKWPELFFQYGPFFIVLVLMLVCARTIGKHLQAAIERHATDGDVRFWRWMYAGIWMFSGFLVIAACVWWVRNKDVESAKAYVVRIDISDVQPTDVLEPFSEELFYRNHDPNDPALRRDTFVAVSEKPFRLRQPLIFVHRKGADAAKAIKYPVPVDEEMLKERSAAYSLAFDEADGKYRLVPSSGSATAVAARHASFSLIGSAFANGGRAIVPGEQVYLPRAPSPAQLQNVQRAAPAPGAAEDEAIATLLSESSSIARQLDALDVLVGSAARGVSPDYLQRRGKGDETLLSYLLTLSHHQDKLLAYKTRMLLERTDYIGMVGRIASGKSPADVDAQRRILASLEPAEWEAVEQRLRKDGVLITSAARASRRGSSPVPSATVEGTEYFGVTTWSRLTSAQSSCLAAVVFRQNDVPGARPDEALGFVQSRNGFAFSFRTKSEAVVFADATAKCGANTEFVYKNDQKLSRFRDD